MALFNVATQLLLAVLAYRVVAVVPLFHDGALLDRADRFIADSLGRGLLRKRGRDDDDGDDNGVTSIDSSFRSHRSRSRRKRRRKRGGRNHDAANRPRGGISVVSGDGQPAPQPIPQEVSENVQSGLLEDCVPDMAHAGDPRFGNIAETTPVLAIKHRNRIYLVSRNRGFQACLAASLTTRRHLAEHANQLA